MESRPTAAEKKKEAAKAKPAPKKKLGFKEKHELENMEVNIQKAEALLAELTSESSRPENVANAARSAELYAEMGRVQAEIERLYARWSELEG